MLASGTRHLSSRYTWSINFKILDHVHRIFENLTFELGVKVTEIGPQRGGDQRSELLVDAFLEKVMQHSVKLKLCRALCVPEAHICSQDPF